jgi:glutamine amidotransferase PdxT
MTKIGIVFTEGNYRDEAVFALTEIGGYTYYDITRPEDVRRVDVLILPGGNSTAILSSLHKTGLADALKDVAKDGKPIWGLCAGMVVLAERSVVADDMHEEVRKAGYDPEPLEGLGIMPCTVQRFAWGCTTFGAIIEQVPFVGSVQMSDAPAPAHGFYRSLAFIRGRAAMIEREDAAIIATSWWRMDSYLELMIMKRLLGRRD